MSDLYKEICTEQDDMFVVLCELTEIKPTKESIERFYEYIRMLRSLPKPFFIRLDTTKSFFSSYLPYMPKLIKELSTSGDAKVLQIEIILVDVLGVVAVLNKIIKLFSHEEVVIKLNVV